MANMKRRWGVFVIVTLAVFLTLFFWPDEWIHFHTVSRWFNVLAISWIGAPALLLIPMTLGWVSFGAENPRTRFVLFALTTVLLGLFFLLMWNLSHMGYGGFWIGWLQTLLKAY